MNLFKRINARREEQAGLTDKQDKPAPKEAPKDKPKRTMSQAEFSGYAKGGSVSRGYGMARSGKKCKMV